MHLDLVATWSREEAVEQFLRCCGARVWAETMADARPFNGEDALWKQMNAAFDAMQETDWLQAFAAHPKIGDADAIRKKFASTAAWSSQEQGSMAQAAQDLLEELAEANRVYAERNGFIFIVCATGKSPREMLGMLRERLGNDRQTELAIAAGEQKKITRLRLEKLLG